MPTVTISLPESLREFVEQQVATRGYGNVSEYFRTLLREAQQREAERRLEELLLAGLESGEGIEATPEFWSGLKAEVAQRVRARRAEQQQG
jgi:antitoxin ParD1/3/4